MKKRYLIAATAVMMIAPSAPALAFDWNGFYAGVSAGYTSGNVGVIYDLPAYPAPDFSMAPAGGFAGVTLGYNAAVGGGLIIGAEADISLAKITDTVPDYWAGQTVTSTTDWTGTLRGRIGYDAGEFLPYLTGGVIYSHSIASASLGALEEAAVLTGATLGAGIEVAVTDAITLKGEYLYSKFGDHTWYAGKTWQDTSSLSSHAVRGGINFHF